MKRAFIYTLKVFLTTIILAPGLATAITFFGNPEIYKPEDALYTLIIIPAGLLLCIPSYVLFGLIASYLNKLFGNIFIIKTLLSLAALPLTLLPFGIMNYHTIINSNYWPSIAPWLGSYAGITVLGVWVYRLNRLITNTPPLQQGYTI